MTWSYSNYKWRYSIELKLYFLILMLLFSRILHKSSKYRGYPFEENLKEVRKIGEFKTPIFKKSGVSYDKTKGPKK